MPHYKCTPCRTRLRRSGYPELVADLCPDCGALLEPVGELSEVVGFRAITFRDDGSDVGAAGFAAEAVSMPWPDLTS
jgi:hypothetical protein